MISLAAALTHADGPGPTPGWDRHAPCHGDGTAYFPGGHDNDAVLRAQATCATCPLQLDCLTDGILAARSGLSPGIRAGHSSRRIRAAAAPGRTRKRRARAAAVRAHATGATVVQLAAEYGVTARTVHRWIATEAA